MGSTVPTKPAGCLLLADRRGTLTSRRSRAWGDSVVRPLRFKTIGTAAESGRAPDERSAIVVGNKMWVPGIRETGTSTDRLVAALGIMVQQAHRNRPGGAGTLPSSSELRTI
jgi:hypothetical protein